MSTPTALPHRYGPADSGFACFGCWTDVPSGAQRCPRCGTLFVGAEPARLWQLEAELSRIDGQRAEVAAEAGRLRASLMAGAAPVPAAPAVGAVSLPAFPRSAPAAVTGGARPGVRWGGQQLLLALGGFLLLSGASFFLYVAWDLIGLLGQAVVMVVLTLTAAFAARAATVHRLPAAAETAALIATGLLVLDITAARSLGLFGLDAVDPNLYFGFAGLLVAAVLVGFDLVVPEHLDGEAGRERLRPVTSYRPIAAFVAAASAWNLIGLLDVIGGERPGAVVLSAVLLAVGAAGAAVAGVAQVFDRPGGLALKGSTFAALVLAVPALLGHVVVAVAEGYGPQGADRLGAFLLLLVLPAALLSAVGLFGRTAAGASWVRGAVAVAALGFLLAVSVWLWVAPRDVLLVIGVVAALTLVALAVLPFVRPEFGDDTTPRGGALELADWVIGGVGVALGAMVLLLDRSGCATMAQFVDVSLAGGAGTGPLAPMAWWMPVLPFAGVATFFVLSAVRLRADERGNAGLVLAGHLVGVTALCTALRDAPVVDWDVPMLVAGLLAAGLAGLRAWGVVADVRTAPDGAGMTERLHLTASVLLLALAVFTTSAVSAGSVIAFALVAAVAHLLVAVAPGRVEVGWWTVLWVSIAAVTNGVDRGFETIEAYTSVPAAALVALGLARWLRGHTRSSWGVLGLALAVGLLPSILTMLVVQDAARTAWVTVAALVLLLGGCAARWAAPVAFGSLGLVAVGWLQGDVWAEYVPTWLTLTLAGGLLLAVGVSWERAVSVGRRSSQWFASLH